MKKALAIALCTTVSFAASEAQKEAAAPSKRPTYSKEEEIALALSAGPPHFKEEAGVWLLGADGFVLHRESRNGFNCLVVRGDDGTQEPECFDAEGSRTLMKEALLEGRLMQQGRSKLDIERAVGAAYAKGEIRPPSKPGVNYMLSSQNRVVLDDKTGRVGTFPGHVMFYAPYMTNADVGAAPDGSSPVFVIKEGTPGAYMIVTVGHGAH